MLRKEEQQPSRADKESAAADLFANDFAQHGRILVKYVDSECKENNFYSLSFGRAEASIY